MDLIGFYGGLVDRFIVTWGVMDVMWLGFLRVRIGWR